MQRQRSPSVVGVFLAMAVLVGVVSAGAQTKDPVVGTWKLDVAKSTYKPGPGPKSVLLTIDAAGKGIKVAVDAVGADGAPMKWGFTTQRDGKEVPVTGNPMYDTATTTQANPSTGTTEYKKGGKPVSTSKVVVSADGKTMTITSAGTDAKGQAFNNVGVYARQ